MRRGVYEFLVVNKLVRTCVSRTMPWLELSLVFACSLPAGLFTSNLGRISGRITDQTAGAIGNAMVTVTDVDRGIARPLLTDNSGSYSAGSLTPGTYTVRVEAMGFRAIEREGHHRRCGSGRPRGLDPADRFAVTETITVTGELPMINTSNATLGGQIENKIINEIPLNGRNFQHLLDYQPGMISSAAGNANTHASNGNRTDANVWVIDGLV